MMKSVQSIATVVLLIVQVIVAIDTHEVPDTYTNNQLSRQLFKLIGEDPQGKKDFYSQLSRQTQQQWAHYLNFDSQQILLGLQTQKITWHIHVKLIGFSGEGNNQLTLSEIDVQQYLKSLKGTTNLVELQTEKHVGISGEFQFTVSKVARHVHDEIEGAIKGAIRSASQSPDPNVQYVSYKVVDNVVKREHHPQSGMFTVFVINAKHPEQDYTYSYNNEPEACPGNFWVDGDMSYMWVDLTAFPVTYGPSGKGEGKVLPHSFPRIQNYKQNVAKLGLMTDIANMVLSAAKQMVATPIQLLPKMHPLADVIIKVIHLHDTPKWLPPEIPQLNMDLIKTQFNQLLLSQQKLQVVESYISMGSCDVCVTAYTRALKMRSLLEQKSESPVNPGVHLDSTELLHWMSHYKDRILHISGLQPEERDFDPQRAIVIPVFLFHTLYDHVLLLDQKYQTLGANGIVVGVVSRAGETISDYQCMGRSALLQPGNITRAVMSAILEGVWGVPPPERTWNDANGLGYDYKWTVGHNPFGLLATSTTLPFFHKTAAARNVLLSLRNQTLEQITPVLQGFQKIAEQNKMHPTTRQFLMELRARQNLLLFKVQRAMRLTARWQFSNALELMLSAQHDARGLRQIAIETYGLSNGRIKCYEKQNTGTIVLGTILGMFGVILMLLFGMVIVMLLRTRKVKRRRGKKAL
eukprot:TRINITY_DN6986_c0_g1_i1.p1 TRINITY_DN6986_c0_g1~~TRINITY_DN6986_c0_g1_i1.p1  ORF type:complete len:691 (+),score=80.36 TRINITY_DN6986_c0_g1_i1:89-2161(+)